MKSHARAVRHRLRFGPVQTVPGVEGLPHPVRGALRPDLHHQGVAQVPPQRRVQAGGEAEVAADANPAGRTAGAGQLGGDAGVAGEAPGDPDRAAGAGTVDEGDARRHDRRREDEEDGSGRGRRCHQRQHRPVAELRPPPLAEVHISSRPQRLQQPQATTKRPNRRSMATEPPTAIRPAEAPRVKSRSRRDGTWKECTTRTATSRIVRGLTTDVMPRPAS